MATVERGKVTRVASSGVFVTIHRLTGAEEHGPCQQVWSPYLVEPQADPSTTLTADAHVHPIDTRPLVAGDAVAVASVGGLADDWIVLGRLI